MFLIVVSLYKEFPIIWILKHPSKFSHSYSCLWVFLLLEFKAHSFVTGCLDI